MLISKEKKPGVVRAICNREDLSENLHAAGFYHVKRKVVKGERNNKMVLNSNNSNLLALIFIGDLPIYQLTFFTMHTVEVNAV